MSENSAYSPRKMCKSSIKSPKKKSKTIILKPPEDNQRPGRKIRAQNSNEKLPFSPALFLTTNLRRRFLIKEKARKLISLQRQLEASDEIFTEKWLKKPAPKKAQRIASLAKTNSPLWNISDTITESKSKYYVQSLKNFIENPFQELSFLSVLPGGFFPKDREMDINELHGHNNSTDKINSNNNIPNSLPFSEKTANNEISLKSSKNKSVGKHARNYRDLNSSSPKSGVGKRNDTTKLPLVPIMKNIKKTSPLKSLNQKNAKSIVGENKQIGNDRPKKHLKINKIPCSSHRYIFRSNRNSQSTCNESFGSDIDSNSSTNSPFKCTRSKNNKLQNESFENIQRSTKVYKELSEDTCNKSIKKSFKSKKLKKRKKSCLLKKQQNSGQSTKKLHLSVGNSFEIDKKKLGDQSSNLALCDVKDESSEIVSSTYAHHVGDLK